MSQSHVHPTDLPLVETIPPQMVSTPSSLDDLNKQAQEFELFILKHRHDPTLEGVLSAALPSFEVACKRLGEPQGKLPALTRLRAEVANGHPFAGYMEWLEKKVVVKKPALAPHLAPTKPVSDRRTAPKSAPGPRSNRRRRKVTGKAITVGHSPLKARKVVVRAPRKNLAQVAVQLAQTRSKPGPYFVPPIEHACDYCVSQGLSHKCLYPGAKAPVCIICKARKRSCVCNERRAVLGLEPKEKEALSSKLRSSRSTPSDGGSVNDLTAVPSLSGPQQAGDGSGTDTAAFSAHISAQDSALRTELDEVSARLAILQGIISSAVGSDAMRELSPLVGEEASTRAALDLHSLFKQLGPLRPANRQYEPFKQLIERFLNVTNHQLALHLEFTKAVTNLLPVLTESADLIDRFAECVL